MEQTHNAASGTVLISNLPTTDVVGIEFALNSTASFDLNDSW